MEPGQISGLHGEVSGLPVPLSARVTEQQLPELRVYTVATEWSQSDPVRGSRQRYLQQWTLLADNNDHKSIKTVLPPGPCVPAPGELLSRLSPVRGLRAVVREKGDHQLLEIWDCHGLSKCLNLTALNKHGSVYDDAQFGCLSWSRCESKLLYVAEKSRNMSAKMHPLPECQKDRSVYCEDWGEALTSKSLPVICSVNLQSGSVSVLEGIPSDVSPGQALWAPCSQFVFFVGWYHEPFRLGLKFCSNRRSALFKLDLDGNCERLSGDNLSISCPRLSPDASTLVYLQGRVFGPHNQCLSLQQLDLDSGKTSTLLDVVHRPPAGDFAGVYEALPACCWSADSQRVVFSSACRNQKDVFVVDRRTNRVTSLSDSKNSPSPSSPPPPPGHLSSSSSLLLSPLPPPPPPSSHLTSSPSFLLPLPPPPPPPPPSHHSLSPTLSLPPPPPACNLPSSPLIPSFPPSPRWPPNPPPPRFLPSPFPPPPTPLSPSSSFTFPPPPDSPSASDLHVFPLPPPPPPSPPPLPSLLLHHWNHNQEHEGLSERYGSWKLLAVQKDLMVVCCSSPSTPPTLRVGFLPSAGEAVTWLTLHQHVRTFQFTWTVLDVTPSPEEDNTTYPGLDFGAILVKPSSSSSEGQFPLVVFIHGGPHSQFPAEWNSTTAGLVQLGFAVLMVNYRGSTGFGQDSILSLIGQIGSQDVKDVQRAVLAALQTDVTLDSKRVAAIGGSHGGFLSCHLVGQYPDFYRACAVRNPVINAATLLGTSDIIDWRYTSVGFQYSYQQVPTAEALAVMLEKSPITHAAQIKAPVLLMLGGRDRRVNPHQGLELYRALKSRASPVRLLWFPEDGHSLSRVDTQADCFLNTVLWLQQHL